MKKIRIGIIAGEASGDVLAAGMLKELKLIYPDAIFEGIGGQHMLSEGFNSHFDMEELSVMGLVEVLKHLPRLLNIRKRILQHFFNNPPDVFIGVDAPDFNLPVEIKLKSKGIKTVHYVSPTVWAWRESRIHKIAKATHLVLGIFPFEQVLYEKYQLPYQYVGHTMADGLEMKSDYTRYKAEFDVDHAQAVLAILPGSRSKEVSELLPIFIKTANLLVEKLPRLSVIIPAVNKARYAQIQDIMEQQTVNFDYQISERPARDAMLASDAVLLTSGTASLEAMLCKKPMVVAYKMSTLTYKIMQRLYKPDYFALPNILANKELVPELLQEQVNPQEMSNVLASYLDLDYQQTVLPTLIEEFDALHSTLKLNADRQAALAIKRLIEAN